MTICSIPYALLNAGPPSAPPNDTYSLQKPHGAGTDYLGPDEEYADAFEPLGRSKTKENDMSYVSGFLTPVENARKDEYIQSAKDAWLIFRDYGALQQIECWGDEVPAGQHTDFRRAVDLKEGETVCFSWIVWPDKETSQRCEAAMESDERFRNLSMPFDGKRFIYGSFATVFEANA